MKHNINEVSGVIAAGKLIGRGISSFLNRNRIVLCTSNCFSKQKELVKIIQLFLTQNIKEYKVCFIPYSEDPVILNKLTKAGLQDLRNIGFSPKNIIPPSMLSQYDTYDCIYVINDDPEQFIHHISGSKKADLEIAIRRQKLYLGVNGGAVICGSKSTLFYDPFLQLINKEIVINSPEPSPELDNVYGPINLGPKQLLIIQGGIYAVVSKANQLAGANTTKQNKYEI